MIQIQGSTGTIPRTDVILDIAGTFNSVLVMNKPDEVTKNTVPNPGGSFRIARATAALSGAQMITGAIVFAARWDNPTGLCCIESLRERVIPLGLQTGVLTDATSFDFYIARNFTVPMIGGTPLVSGTPMRANLPASLFGDMRIATFARLLSGTYTPDPHALAGSLRKANRVNRTGTEETISPFSDDINLVFMGKKGEHPIVLAQNEGILLVNRTVWGPSGSAVVVVEMAWSEGPSFGAT